MPCIEGSKYGLVDKPRTVAAVLMIDTLTVEVEARTFRTGGTVAEAMVVPGFHLQDGRRVITRCVSAS